MATNDSTSHDRKMIAISSGKGGVGKSTVTANIAVAMAEAGLRVGIVDADIYGPSIPGMLGIAADAKPAMTPEQKVVPSEAFGVKVISMAMLSPDDEPAILRGPMVGKYLKMFVQQVDWGALDVLLLDLPPGTGDIQLTLAQAFPLTGAVVVSTPQDVSLKIARRGLRMMEQVNVPILGVVENMSGFTCPSCGEVTHIFHQGGGERIAEDIGVPFLGSVPLDPEVVETGDAGTPLVTAAPDSPAAAAYRQIAETLSDGKITARGIATPFTWTLADGAGRPDPSTPTPGGPADLLVALGQSDIGFVLTWADGHEQHLTPLDLRLACCCAACRDEITGADLLDARSVPLDIGMTQIWSIGNYALGLAFSDGHSTGIYTFKALREIQGTELEDV